MKKYYDCTDNSKIVALIKKKASEFEITTPHPTFLTL